MNELHYQLDLLKAMNQKLSDKERMYHMVCASIEGAYLYYSFEKNQITTLGQWKEIFDFEIHDPRDFDCILDTVEDSCLLSLRDTLYLEKNGEETGAVECRMKGKRRWLRFRVQVSYDRIGQPTDKVIYITDTTKVHSQNEELEYMAYYDALTGLYNRNYFIRLLSEYLEKAEANNSVVSVMVIDVDDFRKINDGIGMVEGDELVQLLGFFLKEICEENVIACHMHTDVFCMAVYEPNAVRNVETIHRAIQKRIKKPFHLSTGKNVVITLCSGVAEYPEASTSVLELLNCAEIMVYKGKALGVANSIQYFTPTDQQSFVQDSELDGKLKKAVHNRRFQLYYQPQYYAGNKRLRGVEALLRWKDEEGGMISPSVFIPIAEKNGSIIALGDWVVEESVRQYAQWRKRFGAPFTLSINISSLQYKKENFVEFVVEILDRYKVKPSEIELEITESVLIDDFEAVCEKLKLLRNYGIRISLDDFGTGFSSLSYLKKLPIDTLKIDKSFIDTVMLDSTTRVITESIINMVKALGFESIAEGVEEEQQYRYLYAVGCDAIQGYLFNKPMPPEQLEEVLASEL